MVKCQGDIAKKDLPSFNESQSFHDLKKENKMPIIAIDWIEGRSKEQKAELAKEITDAMVRITKVPPESVHIIFTDHSRDDIAKSGRLLSDI